MLNLKVNVTFDGILHDASKELPKADKFVLAFVENSSVPIRAKYAPKFFLEPYDQDDWCEYNEENDTYYCPEDLIIIKLNIIPKYTVRINVVLRITRQKNNTP